jgi:serine/threonine protein kinase/Tfp pilus assembly protein PilF
MIGKTLSHYLVLEKAGAGGMGIVYRARDQRLERDVALKLLPEGMLTDEAARHRFHREAVALSRLNHPGIAVVHDFDTCDGRDFLVMEYVPGRTLAALLESGPLGEDKVRDLGAQIAAALDEAHRLGIVHRDLKPGNIMVTPAGRVKVLDFGLARLRPAGEPSQAETVTATAGLVGTPPYMAPEQLRGESVDARSDIFSLGVILYEMATGRRPFAQRQAALLVDAILNAAPSSPRSLNPALSADLEGVILRCLEKSPADRFQTAADVCSVPGGAAVRPSRSLPRRTVMAAVVVLALAAVALTATALLKRRDADTSPSPSAPEVADSLAVLPFENAGGNPDMEYLSDGITETLINNLSQLPSLRVIARNTAFLYKGKNPDVRQVGKDLGVRAVLTGRVQRHGDSLLIRAELAETTQGWQLWGDEYDRGMADIFEVQEAVAHEIAGHLRIKLSGAAERRLTKRHTKNPEAYQLYLKGRHEIDKVGEESIARGLEALRRAIDLDPGYALAYTGLAHAYFERSTTSLSPNEAMPKARAAAKKALEIDPDLAEGHAILALVMAQYDRDWQAAERTYQLALSMNPGDPLTYCWYGMFLHETGRTRESIAILEKARELDPLSLETAVRSIWPLINAAPGERQLDRAAAELRKIVDANPESGYARILLGQVLDYLGRHAEAATILETAVELPGFPKYARASLGRVYAISGRTDKAREMLDALREDKSRVYMSPVLFAQIHAALGETDEAFKFLEEAYESRDEELLFMLGDPRLDPLRSDPRFDDILRRMRFPPPPPNSESVPRT